MRELRERAVRKVRTTGPTIERIAKDLGIPKEALWGWVRQAEAATGEGDDRMTTTERDELKQLRSKGRGVEVGAWDPQGRGRVSCGGTRRARTRPTR